MDRKNRLQTIIMLCYIVLLLTLSSALSQNELKLPCYYRNTTISLEDAIHFSDVVLIGIVRSSKVGEFGLYKASVSSSSSLKHDGHLRSALASMDIVNFQFNPDQYRSLSLFFLIREQSTDLALHCMTSTSLLRSAYADRFPNNSMLLSYIRRIGSDDRKRNERLGVSYPSPCDGFNGCSEIGSECSVINTIGSATTRCTCVTGFYGDGRSCTAVTPEAALAYCNQCDMNSRCVRNKNKEPSISCSCSHFNCIGTARLRTRVCGSDGNTYNSLCHLRQESCLKKQPIHLLHHGNCAIQPCQGQKNPLATSNGLVTCNSEVKCPTEHYCDSTEAFSVCCHTSTITPTSVSTSASGDMEGSGSEGYSDNEDDDDDIGYSSDDDGTRPKN